MSTLIESDGCVLIPVASRAAERGLKDLETKMRRSSTWAMVLALSFAQAPVVAFACGVQLGYSERTRIIVQGGSVYPEGIAYDPVGKRFLVGSARLGHLFAVSEGGELTQFSSDEQIATTLGIKVDAPRDRVVAAVTDYGVSIRSKPERRANLAAAAVFDLKTGVLLAFHDLTSLVPGPAHLANDVAVDAQGNIYVTDSLAHAIYKIDVTGKMSVLVRDERFKGDGFTLNGIDVHPDGYLLVAKKSDGKLFRVPLDEPKKIAEVKLPEPMNAADGILLVDGDLVVIRNRTSSAPGNQQSAPVAANQIQVLRSRDGWLSAEIVQRLPHEDIYPTTATRRGNEIIAVASHLNALASALKKNPAGLQQQFQIHAIGAIGDR